MTNKQSTVYAVNNAGEIIAVNGTGGDVQTGVATLDTFPVDSSNRVVIAGLNTGRFQPAPIVNPTFNGELVVEVTNETTITFKLKGNDGVVRSASIELT